MPDNFSQFMKDRMDGIFSILTIHLRAKASKTSLTLEEYIRVLQAQGISNDQIKSNLYSDIAGEGRIFGEFLNSLQADVRGALNQMTHSAKIGRMKPSPEDELIWEVDSTNPCPDCLDRDNEIDTFRNWEIRGLPGSGWSVCRENCLCNLVKADKT